MHPLTRPSSPLRRNLSIALAYMALGGLGLAFAIGKGYASPIFPAAGLALAVVGLLLGVCTPILGGWHTVMTSPIS